MGRAAVPDTFGAIYCPKKMPRSRTVSPAATAALARSSVRHAVPGVSPSLSSLPAAASTWSVRLKVAGFATVRNRGADSMTTPDASRTSAVIVWLPSVALAALQTTWNGGVVSSASST